jgi:hypothetical protein
MATVMRTARASTATRVGLLAVVAAAAVLGLLLSRSATSPAEPTAGTTAKSTATPAEAAGSPSESYSIFARSEGRLDVSGWAREGDSRIGARFSEGRLVHHDAARIVVAVPAAKAPCLVSHFIDGSKGISCGLAADEHPATVSYSGAIGLVPDVVESVAFTMTDGRSEVVPVTGNVWKSPVEAEKASYSIDGRVFEVDLMPRSSLPAGVTIDAAGVASGGTLRSDGVG